MSENTLSIRPCGRPDRPGVYLFAGRAQGWYGRDRLSLVRVRADRDGALVCLDDVDVMSPAEWGEGVWHEIVGADGLLAAVRDQR